MKGRVDAIQLPVDRGADLNLRDKGSDGIPLMRILRWRGIHGARGLCRWPRACRCTVCKRLS